MNTRRGFSQRLSMIFCAALVVCLSGCGNGGGATNTTDSTQPASGGAVPTFTLAWSEYPSWSTFGVASQLGLINGKKGEMGELEKKWGVDIELKELAYDACIDLYGANGCDAVCVTNMDVMNPCLSRASVGIMPTSTSFGADALIVDNTITKVSDLKGKNVFGLAKSVSEYCFFRNLEVLGEKADDYKFVNMDPAAAATAMQTKDKAHNAIVVWNPFVLETLNKRDDVHVLFDSTKIPDEIIDMVVVGQDSLDKPKGREFACLVIETYYAINKRLADPATRDATLKALGEKFSNLDVAGMAKACEQTKFYKTPEEGIAIYTGSKLKDVIMPKVMAFCESRELIPKGKKVVIAYGKKEGAADLRFDPSYMEEVLGKK